MTTNANEKIKEFRKKRNFTIDQFAFKIDMSSATYQRLERGKRGVYVDEIDKISKELDIHPLDLIGGRCKDLILEKDEEINSLKDVIAVISEKNRKTEETIAEREKNLAERECQISKREQKLLEDLDLKLKEERKSFVRMLLFNLKHSSLKEVIAYLENELSILARKGLSKGKNYT